VIALDGGAEELVDVVLELDVLKGGVLFGLTQQLRVDLDGSTCRASVLGHG
jgi:hypothetical protein